MPERIPLRDGNEDDDEDNRVRMLLPLVYHDTRSIIIFGLVMMMTLNQNIYGVDIYERLFEYNRIMWLVTEVVVVTQVVNAFP